MRNTQVCERTVLTVRTPLGNILPNNEPLRLLIEHPERSISATLIQAITQLEASGYQQVALSFERMLADHKVVLNGVVWDPELPVASLFENVDPTPMSIEGTDMMVANTEIQLMRRYVGGSSMTDTINPETKKGRKVEWDPNDYVIVVHTHSDRNMINSLKEFDLAGNVLSIFRRAGIVDTEFKGIFSVEEFLKQSQE